MHKPESILENEIHKILLDFEIKMDHLIPARKPDQVIILYKKKKIREKRELSVYQILRPGRPQWI